MKISSKKSFLKRKKVLIFIIVIFVLAASVVAVFALRDSSNRDSSNVSNNPSSGKAKPERIEKKEDSNSNSSANMPSKPGLGNESLQDSGSDIIDVVITSANQNSDNLRISTTIQTLDNSGSCVLTMTKSDSSAYTATSGVEALASSSTCKGFDVPLNKLSRGEWKIYIAYKSIKGSGNSQQTVSIR